jgi:2-phospho-L-lactate/phosphoenolpyruvate guanylyltransferase
VRCVLVPVKSFSQAKLRLRGVLDDTRRRALASDLAGRVLRAAAPAEAFVVCDDGEVADWAIARGATVLYAPGLGLSPAVESGVGYLAGRGYDLVVVSHGDLPFAEGLASFGEEGLVTIAPDRRLDGTNVIAVPTRIGFRFSYGPGSFSRHRREAIRLGVEYHIVEDPKLSSDIDDPADLAALGHEGALEGAFGDRADTSE